jgi:predicted transcriptional regulator
MKTAISVPDEVFDRAEVAAKRLNVSRSELYSRALAEYLARHTPDEVTAALDSAIAEQGQPTDEFAIRAGRRVLESNEW